MPSVGIAASRCACACCSMIFDAAFSTASLVHVVLLTSPGATNPNVDLACSGVTPKLFTSIFSATGLMVAARPRLAKSSRIMAMIGSSCGVGTVPNSPVLEPSTAPVAGSTTSTVPVCGVSFIVGVGVNAPAVFITIPGE